MSIAPERAIPAGAALKAAPAGVRPIPPGLPSPDQLSFV